MPKASCHAKLILNVRQIMDEHRQAESMRAVTNSSSVLHSRHVAAPVLATSLLLTTALEPDRRALGHDILRNAICSLKLLPETSPGSQSEHILHPLTSTQLTHPKHILGSHRPQRSISSSGMH